jgi:type IV pilus assembly protein PilY1
MNFYSVLRALVLGALAMLPVAAHPAFDPVNDDTDIFLANPTFNATRPNVLIFVDNTANWSQSTGAPAPYDTKYGGVKNALVSVLTGLSDAYNVGLAMFVETGNPNSNVDGAYIRYGIRQMTVGNKSQLIAMLNGLDNNGDKGNGAVYSLAMNEMFNYFAGRTSYSGHAKDKADAGGTIYFPSGRVSLAGSPFGAAGLPANGGSGQTYVSPIVDACQKNFIIVISNGEANDNSSALSLAQGFLGDITGANPPATIALTPNGSQGNWADEYAKYMAHGDCNLNIPGIQNVMTYTLDIVPNSTGQGPSHTALLQSMAINGKGKYFAISDMSNSAALENALSSIFKEVQAVNSVFASTTLPVSVNVRGTNLNQVYIGVFRPDPDKSPRWLGNLKLYKLGVDPATQNLFLADANGAPAENASTGFISTNATSYWTTPSTYWSFRDPSVNGAGGSSDGPDGDLVEKGGAAQRLRVSFPTSNAARNVYTCIEDATLCAPGALLSATPFNTTNVSAADMGAYTFKSVSSLTSAATTATAIVTAHGWATGDVVRVAGATPTAYNGDFSITVVDADTFTYTMASAPDATRARLTAANHQLIAGDLLCVSADPSGYNNCWTPITRIDSNNVDYTPGLPQTSPASAFFTTWGGRQVPAVIGIPGGIPATTGLLPAAGFPNTIVKMVLASHNYGAGGTQYTDSYLLPQFGGIPFWYASSTTSTILDANTISIPTWSTVSGTINAAHVISPNHPFSTGQSVTISGAVVTGYNVTQALTKIDGNTFTIPSTQTTADASASIRVGHVITTITHPTTGSAANRDTATVTTSTAHGLAAGQNIQIFGTGGVFSTAGACAGYNTGTGAGQISAWTIQAVPSPTTFEIFNANIDACPSSVSVAGMFAGFPVTRIDPAIIDAQPGMIHWKTLVPTAINPLVTAAGAMTAGRPSDGNTTERDLVVNWIRSTDNKDNEDQNGIATDVRSSAHGDVLHSRPATINFNRYADDNDVYVFYGSNDGMLHAVKGGIAAHTSGADTAIVPGTERWSFLPKEFFGRLRRLREQTPTVTALNQKDYFFDGSIGVYQKDAKGNGTAASPLTCDPDDTVACSAATVTGVLGDNLHSTKGDKVYLYLSLRRGGNFIYALDVTNPATPKLLWRKGNGDTGWGEVGQTWSEPKVARVRANLGNPSNPENVVLIFGAGYEPALEDINPCLLSEWHNNRVVRAAVGAGTVTYTSAGSCTVTGATGSATTINRTRGRGLLVLDAFNGNVVWQAGPAPAGATHNLTMPSMTCAIPSDVTVLDKNRDGLADRLYVGDTCGNVWRADISDPSFTNWRATRIASFSGTNTAIITDKVKFLFPPDLVFGTDTFGNYTAVLFGTGDREHPFDTTVQNSFVMIKDRDDPNPATPSVGAANSSTVSIATAADASLPAPLVKSELFNATNVFVDNAAPTSLNGWYIDLAGGEKVVGSAVTVAGTTFFNTNQPSSTAGGGSCGSNLGVAREYLVGFADASATVDLHGLGTLSIANRSVIHAGGGYLPSPVPVVVEIGGEKYQAVISGTSVQTPPGLTLEKRSRVYWYKEIE